MKLIKFSEDLKNKVLDIYGGFCANFNCTNMATEFHHIVPNTEVNQKLYPLFLQSPFNCYPICHDCHMTKPLPAKPPERLIILFEEYLTLLLTSLVEPH